MLKRRLEGGFVRPNTYWQAWVNKQKECRSAGSLDLKVSSTGWRLMVWSEKSSIGATELANGKNKSWSSTMTFESGHPALGLVPHTQTCG